MTSLARALQGLLILIPVMVLLLIGTAIALRSGVTELRSHGDYARLVGNFSQMILRIAGYIIVLLTVQHLVGLRSSFGW